MSISLCSVCLRKIEAKIVFEDEQVYMLKFCRDHGSQKVLIATDIPYYKKSRDYHKKSQYPQRCNTESRWGCPYDCGLCPDHEQHSCLSVVELTDSCNLSCPTCYAGSGPHHATHRSLETIKSMLQTVIANEGVADVVQLSGGEPTLHPDLLTIIDHARTLPIKHLMLNTNGIRIATDRAFVEELAARREGFEVYLQFDSLRPQALKTLRGADLTRIRKKALEMLNEYNISTTLVVTLQKGVNLDEIGEILDFAVTQRCVRGVTFQPTQIAGRLTVFDETIHRTTLTEVRQEILKQSKLFKPDDIVPVPCHPEAIAMAYGLKSDGVFKPLSDFINPDDLLHHAGNTITLEKDAELRQLFFQLFSTGTSPEAAAPSLKSLLCCLPEVATELTYNNVFRVIIMQFYDAFNFDLRPIKKTCVHIVHQDGRVIPFDTMNLLYRDPKVMENLRAGFVGPEASIPVR